METGETPRYVEVTGKKKKIKDMSIRSVSLPTLPDFCQESEQQHYFKT